MGAPWRVRSLGTRDEMLSVLGAVDSLWIRAEYGGGGSDGADLDDVQLLVQPSGSLQPVLSAATFAGIEINGQVGASYRIEYRGAFDATTNWTMLSEVILPTSPYLYIDQTSPSATIRFYRAVLNP